MSTNQPPPHGGSGQYPQNPQYGQGQPPPPAGPPPGWSAPAPQQPEPRGRRRGIAIGVAGVAVVALVVGAGVFAWAKLSGGGPQPSEAVPSNAMAYVRLDLDPAASQKLNAMSLLNKFPEFEDATGISDDDADLRKLFVERVMNADGCDIDYADDIEPWIGERLGFAIVDGETPAPMLAIQVSDQGAAEKGAKKVADCAGGFGMSAEAPSSSVDPVAYESADSSDEDAGIGVAFSGDYMVVAPTQQFADDFAKDSEDASLADNNTFSSDMEALDGEGFASMWFDAKSVTDAADEMGIPSQDLAAIEELGLGSGAMALRAGDDYLEIASTSDADVGAKGAKADVGSLRDSTLFAASVSDGRSLVDNLWTKFESATGTMSPDLDYMLNDLSTATGLTMPDDLATLLGDQFMLAVDSEGLDSSAMSLSDFNAGIRMSSDPGELSTVVDKLTTTVESIAGTQGADALVSEETDDGMVIATNDDYASLLSDGGGDLGDSDAYSKAVPAGDDAVNVVFANLDEIGSIAAEEDAEVSKMLEPVQAFGLSTEAKDDRTFVTARLTFD